MLINKWPGRTNLTNNPFWNILSFIVVPFTSTFQSFHCPYLHVQRLAKSRPRQQKQNTVGSVDYWFSFVHISRISPRRSISKKTRLKPPLDQSSLNFIKLHFRFDCRVPQRHDGSFALDCVTGYGRTDLYGPVVKASATTCTPRVETDFCC